MKVAFDTDMDKPIILILADGMPAGGTERQIVELLKGLRSHNDILTAFGVLIKNGERAEEALRYADIELPIKQNKSLDVTLAFSLIGLVKKYGVSLIHTFGSISDFSGIIAGKFTGLPVINGSIRNARPKLNTRDRISKLCMRFADRVVANSQAGLRAYRCDDWQSSCVIYNGVDPARFRVEYDKSKSQQSICMVGNFTRKKDQNSLIRALPLIHRKFPELYLILVGRGPNLQKCRSLVSDLQLSKYVSFVTDCNHPENIIGTCSAGILLSPGGEGISNVLIEYMAMKLPAVATDLGGNREVVEHGKTGLLIPNHEPRNISEAVCQILSSPEKSSEMGDHGRKVVVQKFGLERMIKEYLDLYRGLLVQNK